MRLLHEIGFSAIVLFVSCSSFSDCSAVCLFFLYHSVITHTGLLNDGPVEIHLGGYLTQDFPIIGFEACLQQIVVLWWRERVWDPASVCKYSSCL